MGYKNFYYGIIAVLVPLIVLGSWRFLFGFVVAGAIFWYFGEERVKKAAKDAKEKTIDLAKDLQDKIMPKEETVEVAISQSSIFPSEINGLYHIVIIAGGKSYLLKPLNITMVPQELSCGRSIKIITTYKRDTLQLEKKQIIEANGVKFEVL